MISFYIFSVKVAVIRSSVISLGFQSVAFFIVNYIATLVISKSDHFDKSIYCMQGSKKGVVHYTRIVYYKVAM